MNSLLRVVMPGCIAFAAAGQVLAADAYPSKPIRIIVAYTRQMEETS